MVLFAKREPDKTVKPLREMPLLGSLIRYTTEDRLKFMMDVARECGDIGLFHIGPLAIYQINSADFVQEILVEHADAFEKGPVIRQSMGPIMGKGLFTSEGDFHRRQRKMMSPSFQPRHIKSYAATMIEHAEQVHTQWQDDSIIDIDREMTQVTMSIVGKVLFDTDVLSETDEIGGAVSILLEYVTARLFQIVSLPLNWPTPNNRRVRNAMAVLDDKIQKLIVERQQGGSEHDDFLALLVQAREEDGTRMSDKQIRDEALTLFGAGYETTARSLSWTWYLLTQNPEVYQKLQQEVDTVLQGRSPTYEDLPALPYTLQVFKETLRLYPQGYQIIRAPLRDISIRGNMFPKGTTLLLAIYAMHHNEEYFSDPEKYIPERFTAEREKQLFRYTYVPFGGGPRVCIGNYFALMEAQLILATLVQRVTFELLPGQEIITEPLISLRPKNGVKVRVKCRNRTNDTISSEA